MTYNAISVTELNKYIKDKFEEDEMLNNILVKGEISNFKHHYTGHMYFTLKDENSLIKCVMFKTYTPNLNFIPKDGMQVKVLGTVSVFERDGVYQIYCKAMQQDGRTGEGAGAQHPCRLQGQAEKSGERWSFRGLKQRRRRAVAEDS